MKHITGFSIVYVQAFYKPSPHIMFICDSMYYDKINI